MGKRILITGKSSYIGNHVKLWLEAAPNDIKCKMTGTRNGEWKAVNFSEYETVCHVAGIVHQKEKPEMEALYDEVNRKLTVEIAKKAKKEGVKQFLFLSSMSVYGLSKGVITKDTVPNPTTFYGKSKLAAEKELSALEDESFKIAVIRPPMIYGKDCKGNYARLSALARKTPVFPAVKNARSMLYISNLCEFIRILVEEQAGGIFFPQNEAYVVTSDMVQEIAKNHKKKICTTKAFNPLVNRMAEQIGFVSKIFGTLIYEQEMSKYKNQSYEVCDFPKSIYETERGISDAE